MRVAAVSETEVEQQEAFEPGAMRDTLLQDGGGVGGGGAAISGREKWETIQIVAMSVCYALTVSASRNSLYTAKAAINEATAGGYETILAVGYGALCLRSNSNSCPAP